MNLTELKEKSIKELVSLAAEMKLENLARTRKQDIIFAILKAHAEGDNDIFGGGVLEILQDGFGFLRSADSSYLAGPDDIYVSPSQIRLPCHSNPSTLRRLLPLSSVVSSKSTKSLLPIRPHNSIIIK